MRAARCYGARYAARYFRFFYTTFSAFALFSRLKAPCSPRSEARRREAAKIDAFAAAGAGASDIAVIRGHHDTAGALHAMLTPVFTHTLAAVY